MQPETFKSNEKKKQHYYLGAVLLDILVTGCKQSGEKEKTETVKVFRAEVTSLDGVQGFSGTVEEMSGSVLSFPLGGTLKDIRVFADRKVRQGELIALVDETTARSSYEASAAALDQAKDAYERLKLLHESGSLPEIQWIEVQKQLKQATSAA